MRKLFSLLFLHGEMKVAYKVFLEDLCILNKVTYSLLKQ